MLYLGCSLFNRQDGNLGLSILGYLTEKADRALIGFNVYGKSGYVTLQILYLNIRIS